MDGQRPNGSLKVHLNDGVKLAASNRGIRLQEVAKGTNHKAWRFEKPS